MTASAPTLDPEMTPATVTASSTPSGIRPATRTDRRGDVRVAVEVEVSLESESNFFVGLSGDVSRGGLFVITWRQVPVGTPIFVAIDLPGGRLLADGEIRWVREVAEGVSPGLGIAFVGLSEEDRKRVDQFCAKRAPLYVDIEE
jgi:uncharacterized protein (TIGR02266 family)